MARQVSVTLIQLHMCVQYTDPKLGSDLKFDVMDFKGPTREPEDNVMSSMLDSAKIFSEIWETGVGACLHGLPLMSCSGMHAWQALQFQSCDQSDSWCCTGLVHAYRCYLSSFLAGGSVHLALC